MLVQSSIPYPNFLGKISIADSALCPKIVRDFLFKTQEFSFKAFDFQAVEKTIQEKSLYFTTVKREILCREIKNQYNISNVWLHERQQKNLTYLQDENTFCVTTGHQLNFLGGPAYFLYKIAETIALSKEISSRFPNINIVPIFWMATEDHDFQEIKSCNLGSNTVSLEAGLQEGMPVGRIFPKNLHKVANELQSAQIPEEIIQLFRSCYSEDTPLAISTGKLVQEIFGSTGILCLDGDSANLKQLAKPIFKEEITSEKLYESIVQESNLILKKYGKLQVKPRRSHLFYIPTGGARERLDILKNEVSSIFFTQKRQFTEEEILDELETFPEKFSPNALLRPIYQEHILPNICYIGGNAEIAYWLQLGSAFTYLACPKPLLKPRESFIATSISCAHIMRKNELNLEELIAAGSWEKIQFYFAKKNFSKHKTVLDFKSDFSNLASSFLSELQDSPHLLPTAEAHMTQITKTLKKLEHKMIRAEKILETQKLSSIKRLYEEIFPGGNFQERKISGLILFPSLYNSLPEILFNQYTPENPSIHQFAL